MRVFRVISYEFNKILTNYGFYAGIIFTVIMCATANVYYDYARNEYNSTVQVLMNFSREEMMQVVDFCSYSVFINGGNGWLSMFVPIVAAFGYIPLLCDEQSSKTVRYSIFRTNKLQFCMGKFISALLTGGLIVFVGYAVYGLFVWITFPNLGQYSEELRNLLELKGLSEPITLKLLLMFVYGCIWAVPAFLLSGFMKNKYLIICLPFIVKYALNQTIQRLYDFVWKDIENPNKNLDSFLKVISPDAIRDLFYRTGIIAFIVLLNITLMGSAFVIYRFITNRRLDCGE